MQGENIQSARATLLLFLKSLPAGCLFNIVSFGSTFTLLFPQGSREYNETTLAEACALQENMNANMGGTEILQPFKSIYSQPPKTGYSRQVLLISDGSVWNVAQVTQLVGRHAHETRVFAVGIGHGASTALIHGVARAGGDDLRWSSSRINFSTK
ncbi:von Willebrand factor A domain-containing protein 5A-like [Homarus americanus]|uniref:von Willebrand factor A domain-containing protein 5A-like n=1 Tax=Homarus americanus TaxID=6706 RepID=UPI001C471FF1|nr:von Willebrand factor A domain-containing protein 5A-like [Homarus americanus]